VDRFLLICPSGCFVAAARIDLPLRTPQSSFVGALSPSAAAKRGPMNVTRHLQLPDSKRNCRLIVEPGKGIDLCSVDPGFDVDLYVSTDLRTMTEIWMGYIRLDRAKGEGE
jgi:hypothetical protein